MCIFFSLPPFHNHLVLDGTAINLSGLVHVSIGLMLVQQQTIKKIWSWQWKFLSPVDFSCCVRFRERAKFRIEQPISDKTRADPIEKVLHMLLKIYSYQFWICRWNYPKMASVFFKRRTASATRVHCWPFVYESSNFWQQFWKKSWHKPTFSPTLSGVIINIK